MIWLAFFMVGIPPDNQEIQIDVGGHEVHSPADSRDTISGMCDGTSVSATVVKPVAGSRGGLFLRAGKIERRVPDGFLDGGLFRSGYRSAGLGCDGKTLIFRARLVRLEAGAVTIRDQSARLDMEAGEVSISEMVTMRPDQLPLELQ